MEVDELVTNAMNLMSSSRQLYALKPPSSAHGTRPTLPRSASAVTQRRHGSSPGGARACGRTSASQPPRPLDQHPSASSERFCRGGDLGGKLSSGQGSQSVPDHVFGSKLPEEGSAQLEVALGLALACVLKERTVPKICAALAQATCAHVLPQWVKRVHVLLAQKNELGVTVLTEVGSDSNIPTDGGASHPHAKRQQESLQLPIDRGLAAAAYTLSCIPPVLALCPTTSSDAFDVDVDGPAFGASAGNGLLAVPLDVNGRRCLSFGYLNQALGSTSPSMSCSPSCSAYAALARYSHWAPACRAVLISAAEIYLPRSARLRRSHYLKPLSTQRR